MKRKFIALGIVAVMLVVALLIVFAAPVMSSGIDVGVVGEGAAVETAGLVAMDSEAVSIIGNDTVPVPISPTEITLWAALGAALTITAVVYRRRLSLLLQTVIMSLRLSDISASKGGRIVGGQNKFISPVAA